jgi:hypothetical protein
MFDRHEILTKHYENQIRSWDWEEIKRDALSNCQFDEWEKQVIASTYLGSVLGIFPSHKYYMPWCTNQTRSDVIKDECFSEALEKVAGEHGLFINGSEGDACDILAQKLVEDKTEIIGYLTFEDQEKIEAYFEEQM